MVIIISFLLSIPPVFIINPTDKPRVMPNALPAPEDGFAEKDLSLQITAQWNHSWTHRTNLCDSSLTRFIFCDARSARSIKACCKATYSVKCV